RHTRFDCDWSSDVCSSDLDRKDVIVEIQHAVDVSGPERRLVAADALPDLHDYVLSVGRIGLDERQLQLLLDLGESGFELRYELEIGRASCRGRVWVAGGGE